jgi:hypothetical protein
MHIAGPSPNPNKIMEEGRELQKKLNYTRGEYRDDLEQYEQVRRKYEEAYKLGHKEALNSIAMLMQDFMNVIANKYVIRLNSKTNEYEINEEMVTIVKQFFNDIKAMFERAIVEISRTTAPDKSDDPTQRLKSIADSHQNLGILLCYGLVAKKFVREKKESAKREIKHVIIEPDLDKGIQYLETVCKHYNDYNACANIAALYANKAFELSDTHSSTKRDYYQKSIDITIFFAENFKLSEQTRDNQDIMNRFRELLHNAKVCNGQIHELSESKVIDNDRYDRTKTVLDGLSIMPSKGGRKQGSKTIFTKSRYPSNKSRNYKKGRRHKKSKKGRSK